MFRALTQFKQREGHLRVPMLHVEEGLKLGCWNGDQKRMKKAGTLVPERERRLNEIGYIWTKEREGNWDCMFRALTQFKQREGHCNFSYLNRASNAELWNWLMTQRLYQGRGKLDAKREKRLESLGVQWKNDKPKETTEE
jgi:succinate dehydrogenase/fumarate reductase flavoprotein subunit